MRRLEARDLSLCHSMIPLGSCTMKLNATAEMFPISWPEFARIHPFAPNDQTAGYREMCDQLERWLAEITGFAAVSLQPNAGSQGEYAGLLAIRGYHAARGEAHRNVCLIPTSAHGTNPASAVMAGFRVVPVRCLEDGDIDLADLRAKAETHSKDLAALMVTYPSTHGVFETTIREICDDRARARRPGLHGRREHERAGRPLSAGRHRGRCLPSEFAQDLLHPARRRRPRGRPDRRSATSRQIPSRPSDSQRSTACNSQLRRPGRRRALRQRQHSHHFLDVHPHDGRRWPNESDEGRDPERQLHRETARRCISRFCSKANTASSRTNASSICAPAKAPESKSKTWPSV